MMGNLMHQLSWPYNHLLSSTCSQSEMVYFCIAQFLRVWWLWGCGL